MRQRLVSAAAALMLWTAVSVSGAVADSASSQPDGFVTVPLTRLPPPPRPVNAEFCDHLAVEPHTAGGKVAKALGWVVTGEVSLGSLDVVSFVGGFEPGTSGSCQMTDGNVGLFDGDQLRWLVYSERDATSHIGTVQAFEKTAVRIWSGDFLPQPVADMHIDTSGAVSLRKLATVERFCDGKASVPNIYGSPIAEARKELESAGWGPVLGILSDEPMDLRSEELKAAGIYEVQSCSGTGFGYCSFGYSGQFAELSVVTVGEGGASATPEVAGYDVSCIIPGAALVADKRMASIVAQDSNVAALIRLREDFHMIMASEYGFPADAAQAWQSALNEAFDAETVREDYLAALAPALSPAVVETATAFNISDFRDQRDRISDALLSMNLDDPQQRASLEQEVAALPTDIAGIAADLFKQYRGPESAETLVEGYLRAMYVAAAPYAGVESAQSWVEEAREAGFAEVYAENTFLVFAATLGRYPAETRSAYIEAISSSEYVTYEQQASMAFERAYNAAIERLEHGFGD